jgi:ATP/maltotriose-dependent transcriptional regulator MalT
MRRLFVAQCEVVLAVIDGRLEQALVLLQRFVDLADESGAPIRGRTFRLGALRNVALYLGRADMWLAAYEEQADPVTPVRPGRRTATFFIRTASRALCLAQLGRLEEARTVVGPMLNDLESSVEDEPRIAALVLLLRAAIVLEHRAAAEALAARLACVAHLIGETGFHTCIARHLGDAAVLAGDRSAARSYYLQALDAAAKTRFRPEVAFTHLSLAELHFEDDLDRPQALEHLNAAIPELQDTHMQPGLERALALREKLTPATAQEPSRQSASDSLTVREREIASLVANGLSNRDIAEKLVISEGTVEVHARHILSKLGFRSRAQVAGWFARQGPS